MNDEKKSLYFYMTIGYIGLLLIGLAAMRYISVFNDTLGLNFVLFGFIFVTEYLRFLGKKLGISKKESNISKAILIVVFSILTFWLYFYIVIVQQTGAKVEQGVVGWQLLF
ncbi:hypothetical protein [Aquibacillus sediminis]|uniref:hypothetical protein n=1 Tax=Aquibacillus sediminis TaxID=2574734 RepID=UPI001109EB5A|nr:hypothetical protein [Aquibacillus sediminis]